MEFKYETLDNLIEKKKERVPVSEITNHNYISTENMKVDKGGILEAATLPLSKTVKSYKKGDILISNIRPYFKKIWLADRDGGASNDVLVIRANKDIIDYSFLYYHLSQDKFFEYMVQTSKGTKMPRGDKDAIRKYKIHFPKELEHQCKISQIGSKIDKKINNNNKIIANLEELSQTLFKHWFIDFEFPDDDGDPYKSSGGVFSNNEYSTVPIDWTIEPLNNCLSEIIDYRGKTPKKLGETWQSSGIPALSAKNIKNRRLINQDKMKYVSQDTFIKWMKTPLEIGDILLTSEAPLGETYYLLNSSNYVLSQRLFALRANDKLNSHYLWEYVNSNIFQQELERRSSGSTVTGIRQKELIQIPIITPHHSILKKFYSQTDNIYKKISSITLENNHLIELRDVLLPKLMSGELELPEALEV